MPNLEPKIFLVNLAKQPVEFVLYLCKPVGIGLAKTVYVQNFRFFVFVDQYIFTKLPWRNVIRGQEFEVQVEDLVTFRSPFTLVESVVITGRKKLV